MKKIGLTAVVNMRTHPDKIPKGIQLRMLHLPTTDWTPPSLDDLKSGVKFISEEIEQGGKVLVHCHWGVGRAVTMGAAYLISTGLSVDDSLAKIRSVRPFIAPNSAQVNRLKEFEKIIKVSD